MTGILKKLFLPYVIVIVISFAILTIIISYSIRNYYQGVISEKLETQAKILKELLSEDLQKSNQGKIQEISIKLDREIGSRITIMNSDGVVLIDSEYKPEQMENHMNRPEIKTAFSGKTGRDIRFSNTLGLYMLYVAIPVQDDIGKVKWIIRTALPLTEIKNRINYVMKIILFSVVSGMIIALFLSFLTSKSFIKPLLKMKSTADKMIKGDYSQKLDIYSSDEFGDLALSLNTLTEEIERKIKEIDEDRNQLLAILSSMSEGVMVISADKKVLLLNNSIKNMFDIRWDSYIDKYYWEAIINIFAVTDILKESIENQKAISREIAIEKPVVRNFHIQTSIIKTKESGFFGIVSVFHDITHLKMLEKQRKEFVANVSHEIKTPLTAIVGFVETLKDGAINNKDEAMNFLEIILNHSKRLNNIVNDLLTLSKIETEEIKMILEPISLKKIINEVMPLLIEKIKEKKHLVEIIIPENLPDLLVDNQRIEQVFVNLLDNAIKFTPVNGKISIKAQDLDNIVRIDISDSGIGIPAEHLDHIFERFYRVDKARSREMGGTGLGLSIVKHIVLAHKGKISVISHPGKGSTFSVYLPKIFKI